jgi:microcystin-dependent protein
MASVFLGSLMLVPYNFPPKGFAFCEGQLLSISQNTALFSLLGTTYGGDGRSTFALPNLQGSLAVGQGQGPGLNLYTLGETGGSPTVTLLASNVPTHNHTVSGDKLAADLNTPKGNDLATSANPQIYSSNVTNLAAMNAQSTNMVGNGLPHNNMMPYLGLQWIIALVGIFPSRG